MEINETIIKKYMPEKAKQISEDIFEVTMLDGTVKKFYRGDVHVHSIYGCPTVEKVSFNLIEM